jgi:hypothetical protein
VAGQQDRPHAAETARDDIVQRLERLPPGHPSSPYNDDGSRKPPVPRHADRELPLPDEQALDPEPGAEGGETPDQRSLDPQDLTNRAPESPEAAPPDRRSWSEAVPHLKEQWERHQERWPEEQRPQVDRSTDEPGSWRGDSGHYLNTEENLVAGHAMERIRPIEDKVTTTLQEIKAEIPGCDLVGLQHCLKGEERFKEKVSDELRSKSQRSIAEIAERMPDAIRYTFQLDADQYVGGYWNIRQHLELSGSELLMSRNSWDSPDYKGVNTRWLSSDGQVFEVQFHTPESYEAKQLTHTAYERLRTRIAPRTERPELEAFQQQASACIPMPDGATEIPDYRKNGY